MLLILGTSLGRELGAIILYHLSRYGSMPLIRFYYRRFDKRIADKDSLLQKVARGLAHLSPFTVAMGRLMWLRVPLTLTLGAKRQIKTLIVAVLLAAVAWDGAYIILGAMVGATVVANPVNMVLIALIGLSVLYGATYLVRRIRKYVADRKMES
jgi:membrane-associated protein